jgi:hypothetical protein
VPCRSIFFSLVTSGAVKLVRKSWWGEDWPVRWVPFHSSVQEHSTSEEAVAWNFCPL